MIKMGRTLFLDIETTGFSRQWDYILEVAAEVVDENGSPIDSFHEYIRPGKRIPAAVVELTGITDSEVRNCRPESEVILDFCEWVFEQHCTTVVAHNGKNFDLPFIAAKCEKYGYAWPQMELVDTLTIARKMVKDKVLPISNCKQPTIAEYFEIGYDAHSALEDVRALEQIYNKLCKMQKPATRASLGF